MDFISLLNKFNQENEMNLNLIKVQFFVNNNSVLVYLFSSKDQEGLEAKLKESFESHLSNVNVEFNVLGTKDLITDFISKIKAESSLFNNLDLNRFSIFENTIEIKIDNEFLANKIEDCISYNNFKNILLASDINISFSICENEINEDYIQKIEESKNESIIKKLKESEEARKLKASKKPKKQEEETDTFCYGFKRKNKPELTKIEDLLEDHNLVLIEGKVFELDIKEVNKGFILTFDLDDGSYAVRCKKFLRKEDREKFDEFNEGMFVQVIGVFKFDTFIKENVLDVASIEEIEEVSRTDNADKKRVEFSIHSKYTNLEGLVDLGQLVDRLKLWDMKSFGISDTFNVQAYPDINTKAKKAGLKLNLGCEFKILNNSFPILVNNYDKKISKDTPIVVFDIETTGLSKFNDNITEIGAVKIVNGKIVDIYQQLVNPEMVISEFITNLTGITNEMVAKEPKIDKVMPEFLEFCQDAILAAHNAEFDIGFIKRKSHELGINFEPVFIDTLWLARAILPTLKNHKLNTLTKHYQVKLLNHHRASDDANATADILIKMLSDAKELGFDIEDINKIETSYPLARNKSYMNIVYVKEYNGLKNMYTNVSISSIDYLDRTPGLPYKVLNDNKEGLIVFSGGHKTRLFELVADNYSEDLIYSEAEKYDVITVEPLSIYPYLVNKNLVKDREHFIDITKKLIEVGQKLGKKVIAIGNVYYLDKEDYRYKNILTNYPRKRSTDKDGYFYLRTTEEMLDEFSYLDKDLAREIVIENTIKLDEEIEQVSPIASGTFPPTQENAEQNLRNRSYEKAKEMYGDPLPDHVQKRLDRELNSIISNGYATLYMIARELVLKSNEDGYLVGSRGSVGSSLAATMAEITEVNPLEPHYVCPECFYTEFILDQSYGCGVDLPDKKCPKCNHDLNKDGYDIPFEVFLGFEGDKEPDIDLNFASDYQSSIHKYTETMFGDRKVFRAGTLGTIAEKTAYGMARKYREFYPDDDTIRLDSANIDRIKRKLVGVKRTTGQHAGGLIIVPDHKDIEDFTPIQYPADQNTSGVITTHFDYHAIDSNLLKLDLLGHNAPSIIRMLSDDTGLDALKIDLSDPESMTIFSNTKALNIKHDYTNIDTGSLGIPEFGTGFVRQMLRDTLPTTFEELVRISGLSHGTDVWINNAQDLINKGVTVLKDAICTRDDIMNYLIGQKMASKHAFDIMEKVRKGKGLSQDDEEEMKRLNIPQWYIDSCNKIQYMFPRAHAVAYVMMSYRIAYYKVHYPAYFYSAYFTNKISDFQYSVISKDLDYITMYINELKQSSDFSVDDKFYCVEIAEEMKARDIKLLAPDLYKSDPEKFIVLAEDEILAPLMAVDNVSQQIALRIAAARQDGEFLSIEDFRKRTKTNKTACASLESFGIFDGMQKQDQIDFFSL